MQQSKKNHQADQATSCSLCHQPYNFLNRKPTKICPNEHRVCQQCARRNPICLKCNPAEQHQNATKNIQMSNSLPGKPQNDMQKQKPIPSSINQLNPITQKPKAKEIEEQQRPLETNSIKGSRAEAQFKQVKFQDDLKMNKVESKIINVSQASRKEEQIRQSAGQISEGTELRFVLNKSKSNKQNSSQQKSQTGIEIQFVLNKSKSSQANLPSQPGFKPTTSKLVEKIQLLNLRQSQAKIPTDRLPGQKQETSIRLHNQSAGQVRYRAESHAKISQSKSVFDNKNDRSFERQINPNHISPLPLKHQKTLQERSQIQKLISVGNSDRNPNPNEFNFSDNMERSEVQHFQGYRLPIIKEQNTKTQITPLPKVIEIDTYRIEEKPTQRTQGQHSEIKKYLQDGDWFAHMREIDEGKEVKYIITFMLQLVFIYFNLHFALKTPKGQCMDSSHGFDFFILRPWLLGSALADTIWIVFTLLSIILYVSKIIEAQKFQICYRLSELVWVGKMFLWTLALIALMQQSLKTSCSADILTFGIGSVVIQTIVMVVLLVRKCEQPDEQLQTD